MKEFIEFLVKRIVSKPDSVQISEENLDGSTQISIKVDDLDMGLIIGREGKTIKSIRALAKAKAIKDNIRININLIDGKLSNAAIVTQAE